ncbi:AI-2E family transporter [Sporolactobacillus terrae]|uniref:AI-2E family transporter n=1 Tax=Sporolactobacillus terrae TaxID=269673 RepID=A0ABX5QAV3_9BACL|nr:AI-2E family transporter [Sporolactobacillus terrae]QAA23792.1 AI-2E family transporter [Sporolactobacillus terrae]QAA26763.1 AI-2E family transporter [Sporolactobacillus terrae]UAK15829.1 AI-2E family transporter [Sporolactobacillus terrae]
MNVLMGYLQKQSVRRVLIFALLIFLIYLVRSLIDLLLLTFIFCFLVDRLETFLHQKLKVPRRLVVIVLYSLIVIGIYAAITIYLPIIADQTVQLFDSILKTVKEFRGSVVGNAVLDQLQKYNVESYLKSGVKFVIDSFSSFGSFTIDVFLALLLSLFFSLEKDRLLRFSRGFKTSKIGFLYDEVAFFGSRFVQTFGKVIEAQFVIALVNTAITAIILAVLHFPQLFSLILMVFVLSLIPVAGVVISLIPLCIIGYTIGGVQDVIYMVITILLVHAVEAYVLNPKLMSAKTELPVFYTFVVLIFSEHFFGIWGLIVGLPIFVFLIDVLGVEYKRPIKKLVFKHRK